MCHRHHFRLVSVPVSQSVMTDNIGWDFWHNLWLDTLIGSISLITGYCVSVSCNSKSSVIGWDGMMLCLLRKVYWRRHLTPTRICEGFASHNYKESAFYEYHLFVHLPAVGFFNVRLCWTLFRIVHLVSQCVCDSDDLAPCNSSHTHEL